VNVHCGDDGAEAEIVSPTIYLLRWVGPHIHTASLRGASKDWRLRRFPNRRHSDIASGISIGIQMSELMRLLLKAVRSLPQDEQDIVLTELLGAKVVGGRPAQPSGQVPRSDPGWASLTGAGITPSPPHQKPRSD
jgi:hypothetical protein